LSDESVGKDQDSAKKKQAKDRKPIAIDPRFVTNHEQPPFSNLE
jgi:hypothetical protein